MNNKGMATGSIVFLAIIAVVGIQLLVPGGWVGIFGGTPTPTPNPVSSGNCPSTGLTTVTLNAYQALASTPTAATVTYYVYDASGKYITSGTTAAGTSSFTLGCGKDIKYNVIALNETPSTGFYAQQFSIPADGPTYTQNLQMYKYGSVNFVSLASSIDPSGISNVSAGPSKTCGITATFTENQTAAAFNKPLLIFAANTTEVQSMSFTGLTPADSKIPSRLSATTGTRLMAFELPKMILSTDSAYKIGGTIVFTANAISSEQGMAAYIIDQATWRKSAYTSLSLVDGFLEEGQNSETVADIGATDSTSTTLYFVSANGYC